MDFNLRKINETTRQILKENVPSNVPMSPSSFTGYKINDTEIPVSDKPIEQLLLDKIIQEQAEILFETMTKKHFQMVADVIKAIEDPKERQQMAEHHVSIFKKSNPLFKPELFHKASGTVYTPENK